LNDWLTRYARILRSFLVFTSLAALNDLAFAQLRIVTYNTTTHGEEGAPNTPREGMDIVLQAIGEQAVNGIAKPPDILLLQEQESSATSTQAFVDLLNQIYGEGVYARATLDGDTFGAGRPGMVFNTDTVQLFSQNGIGNVSGSGAARQPIRYRFRPVGYSADAEFYAYNSHYKAGTGPTDQSRRDVEAQFIRDDADALGQGTNIIYAGDFNIDSSSEQMYQTLLAAGAGEAFDPLNRPGTWSNSSSHRDIHTQSPYDPSFGDPFLIGGGMDDRFDFQLVTQELIDNEGMSYISGSYHALGNNGTHPLDQPINHPSNTALPAYILDALAAVSDHLPVVADYQLPARMQLAADSRPNRVIVDAAVTAQYTVSNAPCGTNPTCPLVVDPLGADELDYSLVGSQGLSGSFSGMIQALGSASHALAMDTAASGTKTAVVTATTTSPEVPQSVIPDSFNYTVLEHSNGSFDLFSDQDTLAVDFGLVAPGSGPHAQVFGLVNLASAGPTSNLDLDTVAPSGDAGKLTNSLMPFSDLQPGGFVFFSVALDTSESGRFAATYTLSLSDEDLPGEDDSQLMTILLEGAVALSGDANLDGFVDGMDFAIWNQHKFQTGTTWETGDFNGDGATDGADFVAWNSYKFMELEGGGLSVPEPSAVPLACIALAWVLRRKHNRGTGL
jgi:hypothetical protein